MKNNLKKKVMLAVLAGGMLCANGAMASWYGKSGVGGDVWTIYQLEAETSNLTLTVYDSTYVSTHSGDKTVFDLTTSDFIYGGFIYGSPEVVVTGNSITFDIINDSQFIHACIQAGYSSGGNATNNSLTIIKGKFDNQIYGGYSSGTGKVTGNTVTISNGTFNNRICGGTSLGTVGGDTSGEANKVIITNGTFSNSIYGGMSGTGAAKGNKVTISGGSFTGTCTIYGGSGGGGDAKDNTVTIEGGTFSDGFKLYGGQAGMGKESSGNKLNLKTKITGKATEVKFFQEMNFTLPVNITEGDKIMLSTGTLAVKGDSGGSATVNVYAADGVKLKAGDVITLVDSDNTMNSYIVGDILGGAAKLEYEKEVNVGGKDLNGDADTMDLVITLLKDFGNFANDWYGTTGNQWTNVVESAGVSGLTLTIDDNTTVEDQKVSDLTEDNKIYGGYSDANGVEVKDNSITFNTTNATTISADIYGGYSESGNATGNSVTINGGTFSSNIYAGYSNGGSNVTGNSVTINGGAFTAEKQIIICGGCSHSLTVGGSAANNSVTINGGNYTNVEIVGGYSYGKGNATNNSITINGGNYTDVTLLVGETEGSSSNNILNIKTKVKGSFTAVGYAQTINFTLPADVKNGDIMLNTGLLAVNGDNGGTATVNVYAAEGVTLKKDDIITLVNVAAGDTLFGTFTDGEILDGAADFYFEDGIDANADGDGNDLVIVLNKDFGATGDDAATIKAVSEGIAASLAFVNQGADMVATSGIDGLYVADSENPTIAAFTGSKNRYNTGSHVDIHGWNALVGIALNNKESFSHGVFVEIGNGDIDTYAALNGSGSSDYKGGGYMLRKDMGKGWTIDGAVRAGRVETSWSNNDKGGYEAKQTYYGAHVTFNKMLKEYGEQKLNGYLRYTFTHLGSDSVNLDGTHYGFDSVNSHRTRLGARMVDEGQNGFELYYGAAWEYGFGGDCDATVNGVTTSGPAVDGSNAVFEVGGTWSENKWEINAGLEGYVGAKRGVAGGMNFIYKF